MLRVYLPDDVKNVCFCVTPCVLVRHNFLGKTYWRSLFSWQRRQGSLPKNQFLIDYTASQVSQISRGKYVSNKGIYIYLLNIFLMWLFLYHCTWWYSQLDRGVWCACKTWDGKPKACVVLASQMCTQTDGFSKDRTVTFFSFAGLQNKPASAYRNGTCIVREQGGW